MDVKVVASITPIPLLLEADEVAETVFLDGAHPLVKALVGRDRINVDQVLSCLQRLTIAYLIHLDAHSRQSQGRWDYRWSEIPPLARDLATDPAFACFYLKKWQRNAGVEALPVERAQRYITYLNCWGEGGETMSHARSLIDLYRQFYRSRRNNSNSILRPIAVASKAILTADPRIFDREGLTEAVRGELAAFMERVQSRRADGMLAPGSTHESREAAIRSFADYFVGTIFYDTLRGDVAALRGRQLNLLRSACEVLYRDAAARDSQERQALEAQDGQELLLNSNT
jgi:CRISPR-associated protein Csc3